MASSLTFDSGNGRTNQAPLPVEGSARAPFW